MWGILEKVRHLRHVQTLFQSLKMTQNTHFFVSEAFDMGLLR